MMRMTARLALAVALILFSGAAFAVTYHESPSGPLNATTDWNGKTGGVTIRPAETPGADVAVTVRNGTATVTGDLYMDTSYTTSSGDPRSAGVSLVMDGADVQFWGSGYVGGDLTSQATLTLTDTVTGSPSSLTLTGTLQVGPNAVVVVENASRLSTGSGLWLNDLAIDLDGSSSTLHVKDNGRVDASGYGLRIDNGRVTVDSGGVIESTYFTMGSQEALNGIDVRVGNGGTFRVTATDSEAFIGRGSFTIDANATNVAFLGGVQVGKGGTMHIPVAVDVGTKGMTVANGGQATIASGGEVNGSYFTIQNGHLTAATGSFIGASDRFTVSGSDSVVSLNGTMMSGTKMSLTGGYTSFGGNFTTATPTGNPADPWLPGALGALSVSGSASVNMSSHVEIGGGVDSFTFAGGTISLQYGGSLDVGHTGADLALRGALRFDDVGSVVSFNDNVTWQNGGGIFAASDGTVDMNNNKLVIGRSSTLDASGGNVVIANSGGLTVNGIYSAGFDGFNVTKASSQGGGDIGVSARATVQLSSALQRHINDGALGGGMLVLESDGLVNTGATTLSWNGIGYLYQYEMRQNTDGEWGLYVVSSTARTSQEQYNDIVRAWSSRLGGNVTKLINKELAGVIIRANGVVTGGGGGYDTLSRSGKFNADVLSGLSNPNTSGMGYDALMLYNGSGLAMLNQAVINSNQRLMDRLEQRNTHLRHELAVASDSLESSSAYASQTLNEELAQRIWAGAHYTSDNAGNDEGFAGYQYRAHGMMLGYDHLFGNLSIGGAFSYTTGDFEDSAAFENNSEINTYGFHIYGGLNSPDGWFVNGAAGYAYSDNQIRDQRALNGRLGWNTADYHTSSWMAGLNVGYDYKLDYLTITGSLGLQYQHAANSSHTQFFNGGTGASAATLDAGRVSNHSTMMPLDLSVSYDILGDEDSLMTLFGNAGYAYEFNNTGAEGRLSYNGLGNIGSVSLVSRHPGRHILSVGAGMKYYYKQYEFGASYDYVNRKKYNSHNFVGNVGIVF